MQYRLRFEEVEIALESEIDRLQFLARSLRMYCSMSACDSNVPN